MKSGMVAARENSFEGPGRGYCETHLRSLREDNHAGLGAEAIASSHPLITYPLCLLP